MKKNFKLVLALVLAALMIVGNMASFADGTFMPTSSSDVDPAVSAKTPRSSDSYDNLLTVSGLAQGDVVNFYKIVEWVGSENGNVQGWKAISPYDACFTGDDTLAAVLGADNAAPRGIGASLAQKLSAKSQGQTPVVSPVTVGDNGQATLDTSAATAPGLYMAIVTPKDRDTIYNPVFVSSDFNTSNRSSLWEVTSGTTYTSTDASVKKSVTKLEKTATASDDAWDQKYAADAVAVGDTVSFTVTTTIPAYKGYEYPRFVMKDVLTDLQMKKNPDNYWDTIEVHEGDATGNLLTKDNQYTVDATAAGYTITFAKAYLQGLTAPQPITVTYKALVTTDALKNVNQELNEVSTEFSNNPQNSGDFDVKKDMTKHYTFSIDAGALFGYQVSSGEKGTEVVKVGLDADGKPITSTKTYSTITSGKYQEGPLKDAEFRLYTNAACTEEYIPLKKDGTPEASGTLYKSDANGRINIKGLDAGTYYLLETKAPDGFIKSNTPVKIEITAVYREVEDTEWFLNNQWYRTKPADSAAKEYTYQYKELASYKILVNGAETEHIFAHTSASSEMQWIENSSKELPSSIPNVKGVELPSTGGIGTTIFYVGGSLMVLAAAILLITKRRMGVED